MLVRFSLQGVLSLPILDLDKYPPLNDIVIENGKGEIATEPFRLNIEQTASWKAVIKEEALAEFVKTKLPGDASNFQLSVAPEGITIRADVKMIFSMSIHATCTLEVVDQSIVNIKVLKLDGLPGPAYGMALGQLEAQNPVLNTRSISPGIQIHALELQQGQIAIAGVAEPS